MIYCRGPSCQSDLAVLSSCGIGLKKIYVGGLQVVQVNPRQKVIVAGAASAHNHRRKWTSVEVQKKVIVLQLAAQYVVVQLSVLIWPNTCNIV